MAIHPSMRMICQMLKGGCLDCWLGNPSHRQSKEERRPVVELAFRTDGGAVCKHYVFGDGQPQPGAARLAGASFIHPVKALKQPWQMLGRNTWPEILHVEFHALGRTPGPKHNASARGGILQSIFYQIRKHLVNRLEISVHWLRH